MLGGAGVLGGAWLLEGAILLRKLEEVLVDASLDESTLDGLLEGRKTLLVFEKLEALLNMLGFVAEVSFAGEASGLVLAEGPKLEKLNRLAGLSLDSPSPKVLPSPAAVNGNRGRDCALDVVLLNDPEPGDPNVLVDGALDAVLGIALPDPNRPILGVAFAMPLLEKGAFGSNRPKKGLLKVVLFADL